MGSLFDDDEEILATQDVSGEKSTPFLAGKAKANINNKPEAPLEETKFKVMLELTGAGSNNDRSGVDLVVILDVSKSMRGDKLDNMKTAMAFVIRKLSPIDRLSIVTFDCDSTRLCPLRQMTEDSQEEIENLVNDLVAGGSTNIAHGLETGLKVLNDRRLTKGRAVAILLMSDGFANAGDDVTQVPVDNVPVFTFGFGAKHDPRMLKAIADNSMGGTFSDVQNQDNLTIAFSQCLAGLLTVVVQDLKLTVTQEEESTIEMVSAGSYPQSEDKAAGSVTVEFGDLYDKELRRVIVDLLLPAVSSRMGTDVLKVTYSYKGTGGKPFDAAPIFASVTRTRTSLPERAEVKIEENRLQTAKMIKEARIMADEKNLDNAQDKLMEAQNMLDDVVEESNPLTEMLKSELQQLLRLMKSQRIYEKQGRPFALSSETSHDRQRFAARGNVENLRLFATPRMDTYLEQAKSFDDDPSEPLPMVDEDVEEELAADPFAPIVGALSYYIQMAIQSLKSIDNIVNRSR